MHERNEGMTSQDFPIYQGVLTGWTGLSLHLIFSGASDPSGFEEKFSEHNVVSLQRNIFKLIQRTCLLGRGNTFLRKLNNAYEVKNNAGR